MWYNQNMKKCCRCHEVKNKTEFNKQSSKKDGLQGHCKECQRLWYRQYYKNSPKEKQRLKKKREKLIEEKRSLLREKKSVPCKDCGKSYPYYVMDFDHLEKKSFTIASSLPFNNIEQLKKEIEKCEIVCSNCHRERTHARRVAGIPS